MSSDLLEGVDADINESTIVLKMKASGDAFLYSNGDKADYYHLPPNELGWETAKKVINSLNAWIDHTKRIFPQQPNE